MQTFSETQENLSALLEKASKQGEVRIEREDGKVFILKPENGNRSAFDVEGIDLDISSEEIVSLVREGRERV